METLTEQGLDELNVCIRNSETPREATERLEEFIMLLKQTVFSPQINDSNTKEMSANTNISLSVLYVVLQKNYSPSVLPIKSIKLTRPLDL